MAVCILLRLTLWCEPSPLRGAQMILHSRENAETVVRGILKPGVYALADEAIVYQREGLSLFDCHNTGEFVITCAVRHSGVRVESGAPLLKIQTVRGVLEAGATRLQPWASKVCKWAYERLMLS